MQNLTITPKLQIRYINPKNNSKSNISFGLRTDAATKTLVRESKIPSAIKVMFDEMLLDKETDRFSLIIREIDPKSETFKFIAGLKDERYPFAKESKSFLPLAFNNYIGIKGKNDLRALIENIYYGNGHENYREQLETISDAILKPLHNLFKERIVGLPLINK